MNRNIIILLIVVIALVGILIAVFVYKKQTNLALNDGFNKGWEAAQERLYETRSFEFMDNDDEIKSLTGTIANIDGKIIEIKIVPVEPLANPNLDIRIVKFDDNTKIYKVEKKDAAIYDEEMEDFIADDGYNKVNGGGGGAPSLFEDKILKFDDLSKGNRITVECKDNIRNLKEFTATAIVVE